MRNLKHLDLSNHKIWKDKNIKPEAKEIYSYLYTEAFERTITHISIGRVQKQLKRMKNVGFRNNLKLLEKFNYIKFTEYDRGLYEYTIC